LAGHIHQITNSHEIFAVFDVRWLQVDKVHGLGKVRLKILPFSQKFLMDRIELIELGIELLEPIPLCD
jgi:hypothetical protein